VDRLINDRIAYPTEVSFQVDQTHQGIAVEKASIDHNSFAMASLEAAVDDAFN
jgi:hypothetical protein